MSKPAQAKNDVPAKVPLDDIMIAMDVVDTLRHDRLIVDRELNEQDRKKDLIKRLRKIYKGQGIDVPDHILAEGVEALKQDRFKYTPPKNGVMVKLARLYVSRDGWGRYVLGGLLGLLFALGTWYFAIERPRALQQETARTELTQQIPDDLKKTLAVIKSELSDQADFRQAEQLAQQGLAAASSGNRDEARAARENLQEMRSELARAFIIRIVTRKGELSGLWRIPKTNPRARNYYLIVEAIGANGRVIKRSIRNEETGKRERVSAWAMRVPRTVLKDVQADKKDDGIIQNAIVATKRTGELQPKWRIERSGGEITKW